MLSAFTLYLYRGSKAAFPAGMAWKSPALRAAASSSIEFIG